MKALSRQEILSKLYTIVQDLGRFPTLRELRFSGMSEDPIYRVFGSLPNAKAALVEEGYTAVEEEEEVVEGRPSQVDKLLQQLKNNLTEDELKAVVKSTGVSSVKPLVGKVPHVNGHFKMLIMSDTHIGHSKFREDWWYNMLEHATKERVDFAYHAGDILEGMSGRPGHVYELNAIGFEAQFAKARQLISECPFQVRGIIGNHDDWFAGKADQGINVGIRLAESVDNFVYLGSMEADQVVQNVRIKLFHGNDGGSYAISYRGQKIVESLDGGDKPHILITGHDHKSIFFQTRNVHVIGAGTLCEQTNFMRGKKLAAHRGYWIVDVWSNETGLVRIRPEWNPFY